MKIKLEICNIVLAEKRGNQTNIKTSTIFCNPSITGYYGSEGVTMSVHWNVGYRFS
jgi:hypothetical protein